MLPNLIRWQIAVSKSATVVFALNWFSVTKVGLNVTGTSVSANADGPRDAAWRQRYTESLQKFQTGKVTYKLTEGHWQSCHSIGSRHDFRLVVFRCILHSFRYIIAYFPKIENTCHKLEGEFIVPLLTRHTANHSYCRSLTVLFRTYLRKPFYRATLC